MPRAQFRFEVPGGLGVLSRKHPETEFRIVSNLPIADGLLVILDITPNTNATESSLAEDGLLPEYELLHADEQRLVIQYKLPSLPKTHHAILSSGNLIQFPLPIRDGWAVADLTTSQQRLSELKDAFEAANLSHDVDSVTQSTESTDLLTERQLQFVCEAVERGYYDSPRESTLTDVADALDVSKGAASGTLHRAERRIIKDFLGKPPV